MHVKIHRLVKDIDGNILAVKVKINGTKFPRKFNAYYSVSTTARAKIEACIDYVDFIATRDKILKEIKWIKITLNLKGSF